MKMNQDMDKIKVLLVEDEQTLAMIIKDTLEGQNFIIHTAADGEEGLRMFFDLRPDVLVADVMMPRMDGFEMVRHIRQTDKRTPVLFLTARSSINDVVEGFELGANDYLKKPFGMAELIVRIKDLLNKIFVPAGSNFTNMIETIYIQRGTEEGRNLFRDRRLPFQLCHTDIVPYRNRAGTLPPRGRNPETPVRKP